MIKSQFLSRMHCVACLSTPCLEAAGCLAAARCVTVGLLSWSLAAQRSRVQHAEGRENPCLPVIVHFPLHLAISKSNLDAGAISYLPF